MGLAIPALRFLIREHRRRPFTGPILTLGRQNVHATYDQVCALLRSEGVTPQELPPQQSRITNIATWKRGIKACSTSDVAFFWSLANLEVFALDVSDWEGADYIWDINQPIPAALERRFGLIVDGGMLEHVFDVKEAFRNVSRMLMPGGRVIHMSPGSNYVEHGFYQFSPTLFYDYYRANGFEDLRCFIVERNLLEVYGKEETNWKFWQWNVGRPWQILVSDQLLGVFFCAQKTASSRTDQIPQQNRYREPAQWGGPKKESPVPLSFNGVARQIKSMVPLPLKIWRNRLLKRDLMVKPWGLKYLGKW